MSSEEDDLDPGGLDEIDESECWRLPATQSMGRVAVIVGHCPLVSPVDHLVDDRSIVLRTGLGTKL